MNVGAGNKLIFGQGTNLFIESSKLKSMPVIETEVLLKKKKQTKFAEPYEFVKMLKFSSSLCGRTVFSVFCSFQTLCFGYWTESVIVKRTSNCLTRKINLK